MKKITKYILLLLTLTMACRKENNTQPTIQTNPQQTLSLKAVTDWYNQQPDSTTTIQTNSLGLKPFNIKKLNPDLANLRSVNVKKGNYWLVKVKGQPTYNGIKLGYRKLAFIKDSTGAIKPRILEIIPDLIYLQRKGKAETKDFTGRVFVYDQHHQLTGGLIYSQGKTIGQIKPKPAGTSTTSADPKLRTLMVAISADCEWYDSSYIDADGIFTVYSENICSYSIYDDGYYPDYGGGGGGDVSADPYGGGGGSSADPAPDPTPEPSNLPGEDHPKINPKNYTDCFGSVPNTNATMQVTIYVQEPFPGTTFNYGPNSVGHTAIGITKSGGGQTVTQVIGFYPDASGKDKIHAPGKLVDNSQLDYNASITYNVDAVQFANLINYINSPLPAYDLTDFNCTGYAVSACAYAGITLPNAYTTVGLPTPDHVPHLAETPAGLGNSIDNMKGQPGVNTNGGTGPATHGPCN
ncbi:hypothetical protein [Mucilaginibacter paludis]|uniref:Lipoprotein n=1 Tax=Mucilaginibacter paludis DSM 18603 TaxID=714943 RepID=H1Y169_9SPHI|nr:hypothetical protein [Mucilaginibacter paludis]EHQ29704.1 hypothetical protein Mucpa_5635 [Mucilaginibacter paludis DSM 18603]